MSHFVADLATAKEALRNERLKLRGNAKYTKLNSKEFEKLRTRSEKILSDVVEDLEKNDELGLRNRIEKINNLHGAGHDRDRYSVF